MTQEEMRTMLIAIIDETITDSLADVYLALSEDKILKRLYPFDEWDDDGELIEHTIPAKWQTTQVELAARLYLRRGGEGETSHSENGVSRQYGTVDDSDILNRIVPYAKVG